MLRLLKSYSLLVCTWLFIAGLIVFLWVIHGLNPPIALLILLVIVALIPLAERLKVGDWFDFTRKVDNLSKEVTSTKNEVREIKNMVMSVMSNVQGQQQFNISLVSEEAAQAFAAVFVVREPEDQPSSIQKKGLVAEDAFFSDKMSSTDRQRFLFIAAADHLIAQATLLMQILYCAMLTKQKHKEPKAEQVLGKDMISLLEELQRDWDNVYAANVSTSRQYLEHIKTLIKLREDVSKTSVEPPPVEERKKILKGAWHAIIYFHGFIAAGFTVAHNPSIIWEAREKPSGSRD